MAIRLQRVLIACGLPAIIAIVSFYWLRKRRKAVTDSRSLLKQSIKPSNKSLDSIVVEKLENLTTNQSETCCDSPQIDIQYRMQLRDNNNSSTASNATNACNASVRQDFNSQTTTPTNTQIENIETNIGFELKRQLKSQNNGDKYTPNGNEFICNYSHVSENKMVAKVSDSKSFDSEDICSIKESNDETVDILNSRDSTCDKSFEQKDSVDEKISCFIGGKANVVSHNDNNSKSIIEIIDDPNCETKVLSTEDYQQSQSHPVMVSNIPIEVSNCSSDAFLMSQTNSIEASSSACSSSASCLMANGYEGDVYHNYPDSVSNSAIDHSPPHSAFSDVHSEVSIPFIPFREYFIFFFD
jgi:hypothetical protein